MVCMSADTVGVAAYMHTYIVTHCLGTNAASLSANTQNSVVSSFRQLLQISALLLPLALSSVALHVLQLVQLIEFLKKPKGWWSGLVVRVGCQGWLSHIQQCLTYTTRD